MSLPATFIYSQEHWAECWARESDGTYHHELEFYENPGYSCMCEIWYDDEEYCWRGICSDEWPDK